MSNPIPHITFALEGMILDQQTKEKAISCAKQQIDWLNSRTVSPVWQGEFSEYDQQQINFLRAADAIVKGDAQAYAELCTDNIQLLIPLISTYGDNGSPYPFVFLSC